MKRTLRAEVTNLKIRNDILCEALKAVNWYLDEPNTITLKRVREIIQSTLDEEEKEIKEEASDISSGSLEGYQWFKKTHGVKNERD